jgi:hypothetical protein
VRGFAEAALHGTCAVAKSVTATYRALQSLGSLRILALVGLTVGLAAGAASFVAPHAVAAAVSGVSGAVAAAAVQLGVWTRRAFRALMTA